eukprot:1297006-Amphidinium_carterae.1
MEALFLDGAFLTTKSIAPWLRLQRRPPHETKHNIKIATRAHITCIKQMLQAASNVHTIRSSVKEETRCTQHASWNTDLAELLKLLIIGCGQDEVAVTGWHNLVHASH